MSLVFGAPAALAGLAAALVPVLLHLQRRRTPRPLPFAALRWLGRARPARRTPRLVEPGLLLLRLLLLGAAVLWCAEPQLHGWRAAPRDVLLVAPGVTEVPDARGRETYWLAPGFPSFSTPMPMTPTPVASLLREFDARLGPGDRLVVVVPHELGELDALALGLAREVEWRVVTGASPSVADRAPPPRMLALRYAEAGAPGVRYARAALAAWEVQAPGRVRLDEGPASQPLPAHVDAVLWLGSEPGPDVLARVASGATLVHAGAAAAQHDDGSMLPGTPVTHGRGRIWRGPGWTPSQLPALLEPDFPARLHAMLFGTAPPPARAWAAHVAPTRSGEARLPPLDLQPWLAWLVAGLFLLERLRAAGPRLGRRA